MRSFTKCFTFIVAIASFVGCGSEKSSSIDLKYMQGEHQILGDRAFSLACLDFPQNYCPPMIFRADLSESFSYGEIVALGGDFYDDPDKFYQERKEPFYRLSNNQKAVRKKIAEEIKVIKEYLQGDNRKDYPDFEINYVWYYKNYLPIILNNDEHLGFYNMIAYVKYHQKALNFAAAASSLRASNPQLALEGLHKAIFYNGFSDHFLTDGFAAGHVRNPRSQIRKWANLNNIGSLVSGVLSNVIHENDGSMLKTDGSGLKVTNSRGDHWSTRGDAALFWMNSVDDSSVHLPVEAVFTSLREVLDTYDSGVAPTGAFAATLIVPIVDKDERSLKEIFSPDLNDQETEKILKNIAWYLKLKVVTGFDKRVLKQFFSELPRIIEQFKWDVADLILKEPRLKERLPSSYLEGYLNLR